MSHGRIYPIFAPVIRQVKWGTRTAHLHADRDGASAERHRQEGYGDDATNLFLYFLIITIRNLFA